jgi:uncharacterized protein YdhG (YjbR/CyaY superfamily)
MIKSKFQNIDEYIALFPAEIQVLLQQLRETINKAAPDTQEVISYSMPAFKQDKVLVYFAAFKDHIGFFPTASGVAAFKEDLEPYATSKGTVRFPLDKPLPLALVQKIVKFRVKETLAKK